MQAYKMLNGDLSAYSGFQYEVGVTYYKDTKFEDFKKSSNNVFHAGPDFETCLLNYNNLEGDKRLFLVEIGEYKVEDNEILTNEITLVEELDINQFLVEHRSELNWDIVREYQKLPKELR